MPTCLEFTRPACKRACMPVPRPARAPGLLPKVPKAAWPSTLWAPLQAWILEPNRAEGYVCWVSKHRLPAWRAEGDRPGQEERPAGPVTNALLLTTPARARPRPGPLTATHCRGH